MPNNLSKNQNNPENSNIQITNQFPAGKNKSDEKVKDIFEEGLAFEPKITSTRPSSEQEPENNKPKKPTDPGTSQPNPETNNTPKQTKPDSAILDSLHLKGFEKEQPRPPNNESLGLKKPKRKPILGLIIGVIVAFVVLAGAGYAYFTYFSKKTITVKLNTEEATILIDDKDYSSEIRNQILEISLSGDIHDFEISKNNYFTYKRNIDLSKLTNKTLDIELRSYPIAQQLIKYPADYLGSDFGNNLLYYRSNQGKALFSATLDNDGSQKDFNKISADVMNNIINLVWAPDLDSVIIQIPANKTNNTLFAEGSNSGIKTFIYFNEKDIRLLGNDIQDVQYSSDTKNLYYNTTSGLLYKALIENLTEPPTQLLNSKSASVENPKIIVSNSGNYLALIPRSRDYKENQIYLYNINQKELTELVTDGNQLSGKFSPNDENLIFTTYSEDTSQLNHVNIESKKTTDLNIYTDIQNVIWLDDEYILFSEYNKSSNTYEINKRGMSADINNNYKLDSSKDLEIQNILYNNDNEILYFLNNSIIYYLKLDDGTYN